MKIKMQFSGLVAIALLCAAGMVVPKAIAQDTPPSGQQGPPPGGMRRGMDPGMRAARLQKDLTLTDEVTAQVKTIFADTMTKMQALRSSGGSREDMMALRSSESTKVKALLTPDQATKYDEIEAEQRSRGRGGPPPDGGTPPPPPPQ